MVWLFLIGYAQGQSIKINCIIVVDQKLPKYLHGKCIFGKNFKDSIAIVYHIGRLEFIDTNKRLQEWLAQKTPDTAELNLCFEVPRFIGKRKVEQRKYCHGFPRYLIKEHFIYPDTPLVCNIITLNRKKDKYLFYVQGSGFVSEIKDRKGKKIHWKNFVFPGTYF